MSRVPLTINKYIENPLYDSKLKINLRPIRAELNHKYIFILLKYHEFETHVNIIDKLTIDVLIKIPSEKYEKIKYDVIIRVHNDNDNLGDCSIEVFSNCPSFIFQYAWVFNDKKLLISEYTKYYEPEVLGIKPDIKNYYKVISYEKSIYYAFKYILKAESFGELYNKADLNKKQFNDKILTQHEVLQYYQIERIKNSKMKQKDKNERLNKYKKVMSKKSQRTKKEKGISVNHTKVLKKKKNAHTTTVNRTKNIIKKIK